MSQHHRAIVTVASRLFRERGIDRTTVADVMQAAGLTHGGFYRHFASKEALVAEAVTAAFEEFIGWLASQTEKGGPADAIAAFTSRYLSDAHIKGPGRGCPIPTLGADLAREDQDARKAFGQGVRRLAEALAEGMKGSSGRSAAFRHLAMLAGAVVIARAVDKDLAAEVIAACRGPTGPNGSSGRERSSTKRAGAARRPQS